MVLKDDRARWCTCNTVVLCTRSEALVCTDTASQTNINRDLTLWGELRLARSLPNYFGILSQSDSRHSLMNFGQEWPRVFEFRGISSAA